MVSYVFFIGCKSMTNNGKVSILERVFSEVLSYDHSPWSIDHKQSAMVYGPWTMDPC